ncbi:MAG: fliM [Alphaproteobacteria bacterium]|nr:fliM [Alphaproteobacteria bacterium]
MTDEAHNLDPAVATEASAEDQAAIDEALEAVRDAGGDTKVDEVPAAAAGADGFDDLVLPDPPLVGDGSELFNQADIDALFGQDSAVGPQRKSGLRAVIESNIVSHEKLPMLEVVCDRMVRTFATAMRNLTSDAIDVSFEDLSSIRFGEFTNRIALPAMIGVFHVDEWENYGLITIESSLIYAIVDTLLGGRRGGEPMRIEGRGFTTIETNLVAKMAQVALSEMAKAFEPIAQIGMELERIETSPRFAAIATPSNVAAVATFRVDMDGRGGKFSILLPYALLEPVRDKLIQRFMGEKLGGDGVWETHMAAEMRKTEVSLDVVLGIKQLPLREVVKLAVGQTIILGTGADDPLELHCGGVPLGRAQIGQRSSNIAVQVMTQISKGMPK